MQHPLRCACGAIEGFLADPKRANHALCYCRSCQAFAHFLGRADEVLDAQGGSHVIQTLPKNVTFSQGAENLAAIRLTEKGLVRWYAACCMTPVGNTLATPKVSFVGVVHSVLKSDARPLEATFGRPRSCVYVATARGEPKPKEFGLGRGMLWVLKTIVGARLNGDHKRTPFFTADGSPVAEPQVLSAEAYEKLMAEVDAARGASPEQR